MRGWLALVRRQLAAPQLDRFRRHGSPPCHTRRHLPLWCCSDLGSTATSYGNELQLFDLPSIRRTLGVLPTDRSALVGMRI